MERRSSTETRATFGTPATRQSSRGTMDPKKLGQLVEAPYSPSKLNHLGLPENGRFNQRFKYAKTMTMVFDKRDRHDEKATKHWQLVEDASRQCDFSMEMLHQLLSAFRGSLEPGTTLVGPRTFRMVLSKFGISDAILVRRLFVAFAGCGTKVDYRDFLRTFTSIAKVDVDEKAALLVPLYDVKGQGIDLAELTTLIVKSVQGDVGEVGATRAEQERREMGITQPPPIDLSLVLGEGTLVALGEVWNAIKAEQESLHSKGDNDRPADEYDSWAAKQQGISVHVLLSACKNRPIVRSFLEGYLTGKRCKEHSGRVDPHSDKPSAIRNFYHRLTECGMEVFRDVTLAEQQAEDDEAKGMAATKSGAFDPIWLQRGSQSVMQRWSTSALVRRKAGQAASTRHLERLNHQSSVQAKMPKRNSLTFAELVEPKVLHKYLNRSRSDAGLPPLTTSVEHLLSPQRGQSGMLPKRAQSTTALTNM